MSVLEDTTIRERYPRWVCERCLSPIKLIKQTSKVHGDCEPCKWCKTSRAIRNLHWRKYPCSIDLFFDRV